MILLEMLPLLYANNSSTSHTDNCKNTSLVSGEKKILLVLMEALMHQHKSLVLSLVKQKQKFA